MTALATYAPCPPRFSDLLESHRRFVSSMGNQVQMGRRLQCERIDFGAIKLMGQNLHRASLPLCKLSCADLRESNFVEAEMMACDMSAADLTSANFAKADLRGADLSRAVLTNTRFNDAQLGPYQSSRDEASQATKLHSAKIRGAVFSGATLLEAAFDKANLQDTSFAYARLENVSFRGADLRGANFAKADLGDGMADMIEAHGGKVERPMGKEQLLEAIAQHAEWIASDGRRGSRAILHGLNLAGAKLVAADLSGADLSEVNFAGADLSGAKLICTDLRHANLSRARIQNADFRGAMLDGAYGFMPSGSL
ncbi:MAG: pentapeptide repeat-containing protein [Ferrovibrio sp.]